MAANKCSGWNNSKCEGSVHCPPRCPRFVDDKGTIVSIRPYNSDNHEALLAMYDVISDSTMGLPPEHRDDCRQWIDQLTSDGWNLIARASEMFVGHIAVVPSDTIDPEFVVFVRPGFRNRGIGTELLKHVVAHADDRDYDELNLNIRKERHQAIAVYEKIGFTVTDTNRIDLEMELPIAESLVELVQRPPVVRD